MSVRANQIVNAIRNGVPRSGPPSLRAKRVRLMYRSPENMQPAFEESMKLINSYSQKMAEKAAQEPDLKLKEHMLALSQQYDPVVRYNDLYEPTDLSKPVYKMLEQRRWKRHSMLEMMQRVEQLHVIPDTLPTLDPKAETLVKFLVPGMQFVKQGQFVQNKTCLYTPQISVRDFSVPCGEKALYTVAIVNPDIPDLENDAFNTDLNFLAVNAEASLANPVLDFNNVLKRYTPPVPEKNAPAQRMCVWILKQTGPLDSESLNSNTEFDLRSFVETNKLDPVSCFVWRSQYDETSDFVRSKLGLPQGRVFYRAHTAKPEESLLHVTEEPKWKSIDERFNE